MPGGPMGYSIITESTTREGFSYNYHMFVSSLRNTVQFSILWLAILDDNIFVQQEQVLQTIGQGTVQLNFNFKQLLLIIPQAALLINGITITQTPQPDRYGYSIYISGQSQTQFQLQVVIPNGYTISEFTFSVLYGYYQYIQAEYKQINTLGKLGLMGSDGWTRVFGMSLTGIVVSHGIKINIARTDRVIFLEITPSSTPPSVVQKITVSYFRYRPCPQYCSQCRSCMQVPDAAYFPALCPPNVYYCNCVESTYRIGIQCNQCLFTDDQQMYLVSGELNCRYCSSYCNFCSGSASECMICSKASQRSIPPDCLNCPLQMYIQAGIDNCQCIYYIVLECAKYCDNCSGTSNSFTQCLLSSLRINPPKCTTCVSQYYMSNFNDCQPCDPQCDNCSYISSLCIACNIKQMRADPPNCLNCISGYYLKGDVCIHAIFYDAQCDPGCKTCNEQGCLTCPSASYFIDATRICYDCPINCLTCDAIQCLSCISQYYILKNLSCQLCPSNCIACAPNGMCFSGPQNCSKGLLINSYVQCTHCLSHYLLLDRFCIKCANECLECNISPTACTTCRFPEIDKHECKLCESLPGYYSNYDTNICYTSCGDGIIQGTEECDDFNSVLNDGCSNCQVDPGYTCAGFICQQIIYPVPKLYQLISGDSPYKASKNIILVYQIPIVQQNIDIVLEIINPIKVGFEYNLSYINESYYFITLTLLNQSINSRLSVKFTNSTNIISFEGITQEIKQTFVDISDYLQNTETEQAISDSTNTSVNYIIIALIILIGIAVLFGGLEIFWNLIDLLQMVSYLKYINTASPQYLFAFFDLFKFLQFQNLPTNQLFDIQNYINNQINNSSFTTTPQAINDDGFTSSTVVNIIPIFNVMFTGFATYFIAIIIFTLITNISLKYSFERFANHIKIVKFLYNIKYYTMLLCDRLHLNFNIIGQWYWSGLIRIFISSANDISFMICLGLYGGMQLQTSHLLIKLDNLLTLLTMIIYFFLQYIIVNIVGMGQKTLLQKEKQYGSIYEGLKLKNKTKYYNVMLISKKFLFMASIVLLYYEPIYQIVCILIIQVTQLDYLLILKPLNNAIERRKQLICEIFLLVAEIQLGLIILSDYQISIFPKTILGWICVFSITIMIVTQLYLDLHQQILRYKKKYAFFRKCFKPKKQVNRPCIDRIIDYPQYI